MSISKPSVVNPVQKYIEFRSDEKAFTYFDRVAKKNIEVKLPFYITVLDELATITGYNEDNNCGFKCNEVHNTTKEPLFVKTWKGDFKAEGLYQDIKAEVKAAGGKFTRSIYALLSVSKTEKELVHIELKGIANNQWIDLNVKPDKHIVKFCDEFTTGKKGKNEYNIPKFELIDITPELLEEGIKIDTDVLQPYLNARGVKSGVESDINVVEHDLPETSGNQPEPEDELPF